ncbi:hypothetical protein [Alkalilacustris brevis]|nr:hypothetical protein [Alkalilacustris brevis]
MSKSSRTILAVFALAVVTACAPRAQQPVYEPIPAPVTDDRAGGKYAK